MHTMVMYPLKTGQADKATITEAVNDYLVAHGVTNYDDTELRDLINALQVDSHNHSNLNEVLEKLSIDNNGKLLFDGVQIGAENIDLSNYVEKETGKGLSSNDYTSTDKLVVDNMGNHLIDTNLHKTEADRIAIESAKHNKGYFENESALNSAYPTANAGDYCVVGDTIWLWSESENKWKTTTISGVVTSVNNSTGDIVITKSSLGLDNVITATILSFESTSFTNSYGTYTLTISYSKQTNKKIIIYVLNENGREEYCKKDYTTTEITITNDRAFNGSLIVLEV